MLSVEERAKQVLDSVMERLPELFDLEEIRGRVDEFTPYVMVALQVRRAGAWTAGKNVLLWELRTSGKSPAAQPNSDGHPRGGTQHLCQAAARCKSLLQQCPSPAPFAHRSQSV